MEFQLVDKGILLDMDTAQWCRGVGRMWTIDPHTISKELANTVFKKACLLEVTTAGDDDSYKYWESQCGFIRVDRLAPSTQPTIRVKIRYV
jgi:hypothetical protein